MKNSQIVCPKCKIINDTDNKEECPNCGIIYERYRLSMKKSFESTMQTISQKGLMHADEEFEKIISKFPETKNICINYKKAIEMALESFSEDNHEKAEKIFKVLIEKQPNLRGAFEPYRQQIAAKKKKILEDQIKLSIQNEKEKPLIANCKTCGKVVSQTAPSCPHCGEQAPGLHIKCPKCHSMNVGAGKRGYQAGPVSLIGTIAMGPGLLLCGFFGSNTTMLICLNCNHKWKADKKYLATMNAQLSKKAKV